MQSAAELDVRSFTDRLAIQDLVYSYNHALDRRDEKLFALLWAPQATCGHAHGVEAILAAFRKAVASYSDLSHLTSNLVIEVKADRAIGRSKSIISRITPDHSVAGSLTFVSYNDEFVRIDGHWKFLRRQFTAHPGA